MTFVEINDETAHMVMLKILKSEENEERLVDMAALGILVVPRSCYDP